MNISFKINLVCIHRGSSAVTKGNQQRSLESFHVAPINKRGLKTLRPMWMEAHNLNLDIMIIVALTFRVEELENPAIISKVKTKVIECITERTMYNRYRLYMCVTANKKCVWEWERMSVNMESFSLWDWG